MTDDQNLIDIILKTEIKPNHLLIVRLKNADGPFRTQIVDMVSDQLRQKGMPKAIPILVLAPGEDFAQWSPTHIKQLIKDLQRLVE